MVMKFLSRFVATNKSGFHSLGTDPELPLHTVRVARPTEAGLRQLGRISRYERILEWLDGAVPSTAEAVVELEEELDGHWESQE